MHRRFRTWRIWKTLFLSSARLKGSLNPYAASITSLFSLHSYCIYEATTVAHILFVISYRTFKIIPCLHGESMLAVTAIIISFIINLFCSVIHISSYIPFITAMSIRIVSLHSTVALNHCATTHLFEARRIETI